MDVREGLLSRRVNRELMTRGEYEHEQRLVTCDRRYRELVQPQLCGSANQRPFATPLPLVFPVSASTEQMLKKPFRAHFPAIVPTVLRC
jgi:hypothetical protein